MSQPLFLNWQTLYLRPDPARVVERPFKPAVDPGTKALCLRGEQQLPVDLRKILALARSFF